MFGFSILLNDTFENAISRATGALEKEGFSILTEIDVQAALKTKPGIDRRPYTILGACNASLANEALTAATISGCYCRAMQWFVRKITTPLSGPSWTPSPCWAW